MPRRCGAGWRRGKLLSMCWTVEYPWRLDAICIFTCIRFMRMFIPY